jgi:hypothetical protein
MTEAELEEARARAPGSPSRRRHRAGPVRTGSSLPWIAAAGLGLLALIVVAGSGLLPSASGPSAEGDSRRAAAEEPARDYAQQLTGIRPPANPEEAEAGSLPAPVDPVDLRIARLEEMDQALSTQLSELARAVELANGSGISAAMALRAHEALLLGVVRRRLDRGIPLGPAEAPLARQFALRDPEAVTALLAWSRAPVGMATLRTRLAEIGSGPDFAGGAPDEQGWAAQVRQWFGSLVEVRRAPGEAAVRPALPEARAALADGDLARAITLIERAPASPRITAWLADARRLAAAEASLDRLELLVLADPPEVPGEPGALGPPAP